MLSAYLLLNKVIFMSTLSERFDALFSENRIPDLPYVWSQVADYTLKTEKEKTSVHMVFRFPLGDKLVSYEQVLSELVATKGWGEVTFHLDVSVPIHAIENHVRPLPSIKNMILIASGKGGVGKSTMSSQLAIALGRLGARVGLLDADVYGPNQTIMMGTQHRPRAEGDQAYHPVSAHGVVMQSMGHFVAEDKPLIWRGPMLSSALEQMLLRTHWPELDYLLVDMPPGTGDIPLTFAKKMPVTSVVMVCTPQQVACRDTEKSMAMFQKLSLPILGLIENMSVFSCPHCQKETVIFGSGGVDALAKKYRVPVLGRCPLDPLLQAQCDRGEPAGLSDQSTVKAEHFTQLALRLAAGVSVLPRRFVPD